jgi:hypothetical protein
MRDIHSASLMKFKGLLFLLLGLSSGALLLLQRPGWKVALLLILIVWSFCRLYYFAFYVIEHYIDPGYRFSGLLSLVRYLIFGRRLTSR